jgi:hypothetical protein
MSRDRRDSIALLSSWTNQGERVDRLDGVELIVVGHTRWRRDSARELPEMLSNTCLNGRNPTSTLAAVWGLSPA